MQVLAPDPVLVVLEESQPEIEILICELAYVEVIFISNLSYQLHCCTLPDKRCLSHGMLPLSRHDDVALFE